jgi:hypothetical protein
MALDAFSLLDPFIFANLSLKAHTPSFAVKKSSTLLLKVWLS